MYILVQKIRDLEEFAVTFFTYNQVFTTRVEYVEGDEIEHLTIRIE